MEVITVAHFWLLLFVCLLVCLFVLGDRTVMLTVACCELCCCIKKAEVAGEWKLAWAKSLSRGFPTPDVSMFSLPKVKSS